jgi:hypothetical protein
MDDPPWPYQRPKVEMPSDTSESQDNTAWRVGSSNATSEASTSPPENQVSHAGSSVATPGTTRSRESSPVASAFAEVESGRAGSWAANLAAPPTPTMKAADPQADTRSRIRRRAETIVP